MCSFFFISFMLVMLMSKHMLIMLMVEELLVVNMSMIIYLVMSQVGMGFYLVYYLIFSVCESVLGLSLLVMVVRFSGNDLYYMCNFSKFKKNLNMYSNKLSNYLNLIKIYIVSSFLW